MNYSSPSEGSRRRVWAEFSIEGRGHASWSPLCAPKILYIKEIVVSAEKMGDLVGDRRESSPYPAACPVVPTFLTIQFINTTLEMPNRALLKGLN